MSSPNSSVVDIPPSCGSERDKNEQSRRFRTPPPLVMDDTKGDSSQPFLRSSVEAYDIYGSSQTLDNASSMKSDAMRPPSQPLFANSSVTGDSTSHGVQLPQPVFESLVETIRQNRLAQIAGVDQQREVIRYMRSLDEWLQRDVQDRQAEIRGVVARVEHLGDYLRDTQLRGRNLSRDSKPSGKANAPEGHDSPKARATSVASSPTSEPSTDSSKSVASLHPAFQSIPTTSNGEKTQVALSSPSVQSQSTAGSTTITIGQGLSNKQGDPNITIVVQNPSLALSQQPEPQNFATQAPGMQNLYGHFPGAQLPWPQTPWSAYPIPQNLAAQSSWGNPPAPAWGIPPAPNVNSMQGPYPHSGWYNSTPNYMPQSTNAPWAGGTVLPVVPGMDGRFFPSLNPPPFNVSQPMQPMFIPQVTRTRSPSRTHRHRSSTDMSPSPRRRPEHSRGRRGRSPGRASRSSSSRGPPARHDHSLPPVIIRQGVSESYTRAPPRTLSPVALRTDWSPRDYPVHLPASSPVAAYPPPMRYISPERRWEADADTGRRQSQLETELTELKAMFQKLMETKNEKQKMEKEEDKDKGLQLVNKFTIDKSAIEITKVFVMSFLILVTTGLIKKVY